ncbi:MAG: hypothetical protein JWM69_1165, partial [Candidatus Binatus sp.]|nr:hypothetical protein [Candidatus Binatus sp.]
LEIDPDQPGTRNTLGAIYAEEGKYHRASEEWTDLVTANPDYLPARNNLTILKSVEKNDVKAAPMSAGFTRPQ